MITKNSEPSAEPLCRFDLSAGDCPSTAVVMAVSEQMGAGPMDITPLQRVIDTDAVNSLFQSNPSAPSRTGTLQFEYLGYRILLNDRTGYLYQQGDCPPVRVGESERSIPAEVE